MNRDHTPKAAVGITRAKVAELDGKGLSARQIALALGLSTQAVYQHLAKLREEEEASA